MRVLTVRQPWADAIAIHGKTVENRMRSTKYRGPLAIHAGRTLDLVSRPRAEALAGVTFPLSMRGGGVVALVDLVDVHSADDCWQPGEGHCSDWAESGAFHWVLANTRALADPYPLQGALGLRILPADFETEILRRAA